MVTPISRSPVCFEIGWPMRLEHDFFCVTNNRKAKNAKVPRDPVKEKNEGEEKKDEEQGVSQISELMLNILNKLIYEFN